MDIREVAKRARVSTATVSRVVNKVSTVNPQMAKRVWNVIEELGYYPNTQARALVSGRSRIFGLIISDILNPFFPEIVQVFERIAVQHHYEILLSSTNHDPRRMEISVRRMLERRVEGVAVLTFGMEDQLIEHLRVRKFRLYLSMWGRSGRESATSELTTCTEFAKRCSIWPPFVTNELPSSQDPCA